MPRFFVRPEDIRTETQDPVVILTGDNAHHATYSLRLAVGDSVTVSDQSHVYQCTLTRFDGQTVEARILSASDVDTEPPYRAVLYQALPKGDKLDTVIQKAVECGVHEVVPFESSRCIVHAKPESEGKKRERRQRIAEEAAKQSGRGIIPTVGATVTDFGDVLRRAAQADVALFCYEGEGTRPMGDILRKDFSNVCDQHPGYRPTVAIVVGSEGGFSREEAGMAQAAGLLLTGLGPRILRTETAAGFVLSCLSYQFEL
jgi:16S rRNA (uracil1498-N3)-methyltransferase